MKWITDQAKRSTHDVVLIGVRGMYAPKGNRRGVYDDGLIWVRKSTGFIATYNGNVDPSAYRKGTGTGSKKGMASLKNGLWRYKQGPHNGYPAFRQAAPVTVLRDDVDGTPYEDTGMFGINIHRGGTVGTSSLGCQTIKSAEWLDFKRTGDGLLKAAKQVEFSYILVNWGDVA